MKINHTLESVYPSLAEKQATYARVGAKKNALQASTLAIAERIRDNKQEVGNAEANRIRAIKGEPLEPEVLPDELQLSKLRSDIEVINKILAGLSGEIQRDKHVASRLLCESVEDDHTKLLRDFIAKLSTLHDSHSAYVSFLNAVEDSGASTSYLRPVQPSALGSPTDKSGPYFWAFKEARENGHINANDIPEAVR